MTDAMSALRTNLERAQAFTRIFDAASTKPTPGTKRGRGKPSREENELLRAAVIFSLGALDAYLSDVATEVLIAQLDKAATGPNTDTRALLRRVMNEIPTLPMELALAGNTKLRHQIIRDALADHLGNRVSNHGPKGVSDTLQRMGEAVDWDDVSVPPGLGTTASGTKKPADAAAALKHWTQIRHGLIHQGKRPQVKSEPAKALIEFVTAIATHVDSKAQAAMQ